VLCFCSGWDSLEVSSDLEVTETDLADTFIGGRIVAKKKKAAVKKAAHPKKKAHKKATKKKKK
jgi:hypothetical protein